MFIHINAAKINNLFIKYKIKIGFYVIKNKKKNNTSTQ